MKEQIANDALSTTIQPLFVPAAMWLGPQAVAAVALKRYLGPDAPEMPAEIRRALDAGLFYANAAAGLLPDKYPEFTDAELAAKTIENKCRFTYNEFCQVSGFTGELTALDLDQDAAKCRVALRNRDLLYIEARNYGADPFTRAYGDNREIENEFRDLLREVLPEDFPYKEHVMQVYGIFRA